MKLRDRQEKVERVLAFYKSSKGSPFQEANTHVRGEFDAVGALLMIGTIDESKRNAIERAIRTGIDSRLTFETTLREKDTLVAEFVGSERGQMNILGSPLSLAKVLYAANISDWCSAVAIPVGGRCRDVAVPTNSREVNASQHQVCFLICDHSYQFHVLFFLVSVSARSCRSN